MIITATAHEVNARTNGVAIVNAIRVEITNAPLTGSEKQIAWAEDIRRDSVALLIKQALDQMTKSNGTHYDADALDSTMDKINAQFAPMIAGKIAKITSARVWIDNRGLDAARVAQAAA